MKLQNMTTNQTQDFYMYQLQLGFVEHSDIIISIYEMYFNKDERSLIVRDEYGSNPIKGNISLEWVSNEEQGRN